MKLPLLLASLLFAGLASAEEPTAAAAPPRERHPALTPIEEQSGLPRVFIIGDSISIGYTLPVRARLAGRANVLRPAENCGDTGRGLERLDRWLGSGKWDVIVFNFGLHDLKYLDEQRRYVNPPAGRQVNPPEQYANNLRTLAARLKATGATVLFGTTTPVPAGSLGRVAGDERRYNAVARAIMAETGIGVIDLHEAIAAGPAAWRREANVHFTDAGSDGLAAIVSDAIVAALAKRSAPSP